MLLNLANPIEREQFRTKTNFHFNKGKESDEPYYVELTKKQKPRSIPFNRYLHVCLGIYAMDQGHSIEDVKTEYFKAYYNADLFREFKTNKISGKSYESLKSINEIGQADLVKALERFRNGAMLDSGCYIPEPHEEEKLRSFEAQIKNHEFVSL